MSGATSYQLYENGSPTSRSSTSISYSKSSAGSHSYRVSACNSAGCSAQSGAISVTVSEPPPPPAINLIGFDPEYKGFWPSSSSTNDLYVERQSTDGNNEGVTPFILVEQTDGSYSLNANPTAAQISQFNLSNPATIAYELIDVNLDGAIDMVLLDSSDEATGIVYAATTTQSAPEVYKHIDAEFVEFFSDLYQGISDPDYFEDTALSNGWGDWVQYGPYIQSYWDTAILHLSGQTFVPIGLPPPPEPIYFYPGSDVSAAYVQTTQPYWCAIAGQNGYRFHNGVWEVLGAYREAEFVPDFSNFNEDAIEVAAIVNTYLATESASSIPLIVFQILEEILGTTHDLDDEPKIYSVIRHIGQVLFGLGVEQEVELPQFLGKVELLYTDIGLTALPPFARHAYLQVTFPNGNVYVTRGGPQEDPDFAPFGYIETQKADNTVVEIAPADFRDIGAPILFRQLVGYTSMTESFVNIQMSGASANVNGCNIPYLLITQNSNSYAFQSVPIVSGLTRPKPVVWAPGANAIIPCP
ncbi:MAG: hypothetical protein VYE29_13080 [Pseudomonadota bacterium]|nr:hypothetical protein [Pseudomonadota bacterium]